MLGGDVCALWVPSPTPCIVAPLALGEEGLGRVPHAFASL